MGALSRPGPQQGFKGPPDPLTKQGRAKPFREWFPAFLSDELRPYPGRLLLVLRMTLAATLTMLAIMTFRLPGAAIAAYYTLILARDSPVNTVRAAGTVLVAYIAGCAYALLCTMLFIDYPLTHFLWVAFSMFLCFYVIKVTTNYTGGAAFAFVITIVIPIWDSGLPTAALVAATLWSAAGVSVGLFCTIVVEVVFSLFEIRSELQSGLSVRLEAVSDLLRSCARQSPPHAAAGQRVQRLAMVGVSRLRRLAASAGSATGEPSPERRATTVSLVGRLVDLAATLEHDSRPLPPQAREELRAIADQLTRLGRHLHVLARTLPPVAMPEAAGGDPLVNELGRTAALLQLSLGSNTPPGLLRLETGTLPQQSVFLPDAFTNPEHLIYSLRGCLAAMLCYVVFNGVAWRGLSTSLATCAITALTSVGASRQKQLLRMSGAIAGGIFFGIGSQILILPMLDTIAGFAVLFVTVTLVAAWFGTSSPRLSYFGQQIALAFYLINLQEPFPQTNLAIARDRVMGIALGLFMMWLVFDTLGTKPAAEVMRELFAGNLRSLAELARPWRGSQPADLNRIRSLRDKLSSDFSSVNSQADAVLFELGPARERDLALRDRLLGWQPRLRSALLLESALLQYRTQVVPQELPAAIRKAQIAFDESISDALEEMAQSFERGKPLRSEASLQDAYRRFEAALLAEYHGVLSQRAGGVLNLSCHLAQVLDEVRGEMRQFRR